jgi:hypothetical protein
MFDRADLGRLLAAMRANGVENLTLEAEDERLELGLFAATAPAVIAVAPVQPVQHAAKAEAPGRFVPRGDEDGLTVLKNGATVQADELLGYLAQGDVLSLISSPVAGRLLGALPQEGAVFGYGDAVFKIEASA